MSLACELASDEHDAAHTPPREEMSKGGFNTTCNVELTSFLNLSVMWSTRNTKCHAVGKS